ncbi:MAG: hypothetical protein ACXV0U_10690 [Kineosporiaceae bacterium]
MEPETIRDVVLPGPRRQEVVMGPPVSTPAPDVAMPPPPRRSRSSRRVLVGVLVVVVAVAVVTVVAVVLGHGTRAVPVFPSLAENPDPTLHGTVAYLGDGNCIRIIAAGGGPSKQVLCLPAQDPSTAKALGKEQGPQLVWRSDGRLEVTMFRMTDPPGPNFRAGWQKIVDVRTGQVEDVPAAEVPSTADRTTQPSTSPSGQRINWTSDAQNGRIEVVLHENGQSRTLLSAQGPGEYTYGLMAAFWSPDWKWVVADDGRILVITPGNAVTRVLVQPADSGFGGDGLARFAVTAEDVLGPTG